VVAPFFFEKTTDAVASYHRFTAILYFGVSGGKGKSSQEFFRPHTHW